MKTAKIVSVFLTVILVSTTAYAQPPLTFKSNLDQAQAFGTGSTATGTAILSFNSTVRELNMLIAFNGLTTAQITGFHIRRAPAGTPGGAIVFGLVNPNHDVNDFSDLGFGYFSRWDITDTITGAAYPAGSLTGLLDLLNQQLYFNAETAAFPLGEIRGQIVPVIFGDINLDGIKDLNDVGPFSNVLNSGGYQIEADFDVNGVVDLTDAFLFIRAFTTGC